MRWSTRRLALVVVVSAVLVSCGDDAGQHVTSDDVCLEDEVAANRELVPIYKIVQDIPAGTTGGTAVANGWIEADKIARQYRPETAVLDLDAIDEASAIAYLAADQIVVGNQFGVTVPPPDDPNPGC